MLKLLLSQTKDPATRENFQAIESEFKEHPILKGNFKFFEISITGAVTNLKITHKLGFTPKDVIQTYLVGAGSLTWNYSSFSSTTLDITTTGPCVVRAFIGRYEEA